MGKLIKYIAIGVAGFFLIMFFAGMIEGLFGVQHIGGKLKDANTIDHVKWNEVIRWKGKSTKNTETFRISSNEWRVSWMTKEMSLGNMTIPGNFQLYLYDNDGNLKGIAANVMGNDKDSSYQRGAGNYYFSINSSQPYIVIVEEQK